MVPPSELDCRSRDSPPRRPANSRSQQRVRAVWRAEAEGKLLVMSESHAQPLPTFTRSVPPRLDALPSMRRDLRAWLSGLEVPRAAANDIVLAAWEVCANAIEHPEQPSAPTVALEATAQPRGIRLAVSDAGHWTGMRLPRPNRGLGLRMVEIG